MTLWIWVLSTLTFSSIDDTWQRWGVVNLIGTPWQLAAKISQPVVTLHIVTKGRLKWEHQSQGRVNPWVISTGNQRGLHIWDELWRANRILIKETERRHLGKKHLKDVEMWRCTGGMCMVIWYIGDMDYLALARAENVREDVMGVENAKVRF